MLRPLVRPSRRRRAAAAGAGLLLLASCAACGVRPRARNLVLFSIDTAVASRMSAYGAARDTTPVLRALARRGVRFERAYSPSPWTLPAHAALLSGRYPSALAPDPNDPRLYRVGLHLSHLFSQRGYRTAAFTGGGFVGRRFGADRGFETFEHAGVERAVAWIEAQHGRRFFLFFHTYVAHTAYLDRRFAAGLDGGRIARIFADGDRALELRVCCEGFEPTPSEREFLLALYDGGLAAADDMLGKLVAALERLDLTDQTAIVVTGDHGEEFWQHTGRAAYHGHTLYDELLRVPLVWVEPGARRPGASVSARVSLIDVLPTVVARFGLALPDAVDGVDLSPLLDGEPWPVRRVLFGEGVRHGPPRYSVRSDRGTLIVTPDPSVQRVHGRRFPVPVRAVRELYRADDGAQLHNVYESEPALARELFSRLLAHRRAATRVPVPPPAEPLDEETRKELRALGYSE